MREAAFVKQNKDKWARFENLLLQNAKVSPDELAELYLEVTDNLAYANTFYPKSAVSKYLNELSAKAHQKIYKTKKESRGKIADFFLREFPLFFYQYLRQLLISFLVFALFTIVGAFSVAQEGTFARAFLGDDYMNMTLENIANEDPMAVYKKMGEMNMFMGITINNIKVALATFVLGIFAGIGSLYSLMQNAIMLGAFQYFFYEKELLWESMRTIWIHGTIEISVIIVAGCAGLVLGNSLLFPKTFTRLQSFIQGTKDGLKIVLSTIPFFIVAGFLEGFVTRKTHMPDWLAIAIISLSFLLIIFYYVLYPIYLHKKQTNGKPIYPV
ncbi:MAG TPA: stage II sporulation protein M [Flavobacteriaceae bacterium]|nr:stage II sporulation protein M [Flavobacteriaceae bacterium]